MKKTGILFYTIAVFLITVSCGPTMDISYDYDKKVDFNKFETFSIAPWNEKNSELVDEFTKNRLLDAMRVQMTQRGLLEVQDNPDVVLSVFVVTDAEKYTTAYTTHMSYGGYGGWYGYRGWYNPGFGVGATSTEYVENERIIGTVVIDVFQTRQKSLVWQGIAKGEIDPSKRPKESKVYDLVDKIMYKYPVRKK